MGSYTFRWPHAAEEVYVTGTFDDWSKSEKLDKVDDAFERTVTLPDASEPILYKFVVDGDWTTDHTAPQTKDESGNENNILNPENIVMATDPAAATMNTVAPDSTTAALAGDVPLEKKQDELPGTFPETPAGALEEDKEIKVNPLPAADRALNPVKLAPGEKIPEGLVSNGVNNHVTLDKDSYEKSDRIPGMESDLPPVSDNMIPESSLPIVAGSGVAINSAAPDSSTAALAGAVPLENAKVPEVVKESQEKAASDPEASGVSGEVAQKAKLEDELAEKVPEAPSTSEGTSGQDTTDKAETDKPLGETIAAPAGATAAAAGAAALATFAATKDSATEKASEAKDAATDAKGTVADRAMGAKDTATAGALEAKDTATAKASEATTGATTAATDAAAKLPEPVKGALPVSLQKAIPGAADKEDIRQEVSPEVPAQVKESITEAEKNPEAAANTEAVGEKKAVESELLKEVKPAGAVAEPSAKGDVSKKAAGQEPATVVAVPAATTHPAAVTTAKAEETKAEEAPAAATQPEANGAKSAAAGASGTPAAVVAPAAAAATPGSSKAAETPAAADKKKKNRLSTIFSKIKHKVSGKD